MKIQLLSVLLVLSTFVTKAQTENSYPILSDDRETVQISDKVKFSVGDDIKVGTGSTDDGSFKYIRINSASWTHFSSTDGPNGRGANQANSLPSNFSGHLMHIKKIRRDGNEKRGYVVYLVLGGGTMTNYECDIVRAVNVGEIECDGCVSKKNTPTVIVNNSGSTADELIKLKKLKDDGVITQEEFDMQKKKLLNK